MKFVNKFLIVGLGAAVFGMGLMAVHNTPQRDSDSDIVAQAHPAIASSLEKTQETVSNMGGSFSHLMKKISFTTAHIMGNVSKDLTQYATSSEKDVNTNSVDNSIGKISVSKDLVLHRKVVEKPKSPESVLFKELNKKHPVVSGDPLGDAIKKMSDKDKEALINRLKDNNVKPQVKNEIKTAKINSNVSPTVSNPDVYINNVNQRPVVSENIGSIRSNANVNTNVNGNTNSHSRYDDSNDNSQGIVQKQKL